MATFSGEGALGVWHGVEPGYEEKVENWYNSEHHQERVAIGGFLCARRYKSLDDLAIRYFSRYDTESINVLASDVYLYALRNPSPWSQQVFPYYRDTIRGAFKVVDRWSIGAGGYLLSLRLHNGDNEIAENLMAELESAVTDLQNITGVVGVELWQVDAAISTIKTTERKIRGQQDQFPLLALLVDLTDLAAADLVRERLPLLKSSASVELMQLTYILG